MAFFLQHVSVVEFLLYCFASISHGSDSSQVRGFAQQHRSDVLDSGLWQYTDSESLHTHITNGLMQYTLQGCVPARCSFPFSHSFSPFASLPLALISPSPCSRSRCPSLPAPALCSLETACYFCATAGQHNPGVQGVVSYNSHGIFVLLQPHCIL